MKKKPTSSIDGFIPRRQASTLGDQHIDTTPKQAADTGRRTMHTGDNQHAAELGVARSAKALGRSDIDESLSSIDDEEPIHEPSRRQRRRDAKRAKKAGKKPQGKVKKTAKIAGIVLLIIVLAVAAFVLYKVVVTGGKVFKGNIFDIVQAQALKEDANGRSNFVIFGTAEDDEGGEHGGANLTDSIMLLSVNQKTKDAYMVSLPRDLWVTYDETCTVGNQGKMNAVYFCASDDGAKEEQGAAALQSKVKDVLGVDVQYYIHLNFTAVVEAVDAVGGVDVTIETNDPRGILDRNFDWKCGYKCYYVKYEKGQVAHLDGEHALALSRARNASGGYGLDGGNFDREQNQQRVIKALQQKAVSVGTLTNLGKVTGLMDAMGNNLRTNIETKELRTLMGLGTDIKPDAIVSLSLVDEEKPLVTTGSYGGQSIVRPIAGLLDYSQIKSFIAKHFSNDPVQKEAAQVVVLNGTDKSGVAQTEATKLESKGFTITTVANAPDGTYGKAEVYQVGEGMSGTAAKLAELYGVTIKTTPPPLAVAPGTNFVIIIGAAPAA